MKDDKPAEISDKDKRSKQPSLLPHGGDEPVAAKRKPADPVFKPYQQEQAYLLPPSLEELVPAEHPARVIDEIVSAMDLGELYRSYRGGGASSYDPEMLLKVLSFAYSHKIYSSRRIARAVRENVAYMWLAGGNKPDFRTLAGFRSGRLKESIDQMFGATIGVLVESGYIKLKNYFLDGTRVGPPPHMRREYCTSSIFRISISRRSSIMLCLVVSPGSWGFRPHAAKPSWNRSQIIRYSVWQWTQPSTGRSQLPARAPPPASRRRGRANSLLSASPVFSNGPQGLLRPAGARGP